MLNVAFIVGLFPAVSETYIIGQIAGLLRRDIKVRIFSFHRGDAFFATKEFSEYDMKSMVTFLDFPVRWPSRAILACKSAMQLLKTNPISVLRSLNIIKYGADAWSLKLLCYAGQISSLDTDVVHCHYGKIADQFRVLRDILGLKQPWITTFYGSDVSHVPHQKGKYIYRELARACPKFLVMSEDMKRRVIALGFNPEKVFVHPVGIFPENYPFRERADHSDPIHLATVARLVEKKGVNDLLCALVEVKNRTAREFTCTIVGDGPLRESLHKLAREKNIEDIIKWTGFMRQEDMINVLSEADIYIQPSKTATSGDME